MPVISNLNYADYLTGIKSPMETTMQGFQTIGAMESAKANEAKASILQAQKDQYEQMQKEIFELSKRKDITSKDYMSFLAKYPMISEQIQSSAKGLSEAELADRQHQLTNIVAAISTGQNDVARDIIWEQLKAASNSGDTVKANSAKVMLKTLEASPDAAKSAAIFYLAETMPDKQFADMFPTMAGTKGSKGYGAAEYAADELAVLEKQYEDIYNEKMPETMRRSIRSKKALGWKRQTEEEAGAIRAAQKAVDLATAEGISKAGKLGERQAEIETAKGLRIAKGEVSKIEEKKKAQTSLEGVVRKMSKAYTELKNLGEIVSTDAPWWDNIYASARSSEWGQKLQKLYGSKAQTQRNIINDSVPLIVTYIRQASDMSAKGMDALGEIEFYKQAASNPKLDFGTNMAALAALSRAFGLGDFAAEIEMGLTQENKRKEQEFLDKGRKIRAGKNLKLSEKRSAYLKWKNALETSTDGVSQEDIDLFMQIAPLWDSEEGIKNATRKMGVPKKDLISLIPGFGTASKAIEMLRTAKTPAETAEEENVYGPGKPPNVSDKLKGKLYYQETFGQ